jgi:hypothetical protein
MEMFRAAGNLGPARIVFPKLISGEKSSRRGQ